MSRKPTGKDALNRYGYVVYDDTRRSNSVAWESARLAQKEKIESWYATLNVRPSAQQYVDVGQYLINLGEMERQKEIALMKSVLGEGFSTPENEKMLIEQFNQVIIGKDQYEDALHRIEIALSKNGKGLAPTISSLFTSKLNTIFGRKINELIKKELKDADTDEKIEASLDRMEKNIVEVFNNSVDKAWEETLKYQNTSKTDDEYGSLKGYEDLYNLYKSNEAFQKIFKESIGKTFSIDKVKEIISKNREKIKSNQKNNKRMTGWSWANKALSLKSRIGSVGGSINETVNMIRDSVSDLVIGANGSRTARQVVSNKLKTDNIIIFQTEATIDEQALDEILAEMSQDMDATKNLIEAHREMKKYWDKHLSKLNEGFIIFKSGKAYGLNNISKYGGFKGTEKFSLSNLKELPKSPKLSDNIDINKFVMVIANTIPGAVLADSYENIREWLYIYVTESITSLMFDDWEQIGTIAEGQRTNAIHVLTLNDINIPLSVFLISAGQALIEAVDKTNKTTDFIRLTVHKSKILYPNEDSYEYENDKPMVGRAWNTQRDDALQNYSITVNFYKNFNEAILEKIIEASR